jgi:hypothetical protein
MGFAINSPWARKRTARVAHMDFELTLTSLQATEHQLLDVRTDLFACRRYQSETQSNSVLRRLLTTSQHLVGQDLKADHERDIGCATVPQRKGGLSCPLLYHSEAVRDLWTSHVPC